MVAKKDLDARFHLRMKSAEREVAEETQRVYGKAGVEMSLNEVFRHLVRRAGLVLAHTPAEARAQIAGHAADCPDCDADSEAFRCPDGLYLYRNCRRVLRAHPGAERADAL